MPTLLEQKFSTFSYSYVSGARVFSVPFALGVLDVTHLQVFVQGEVDGLGEQLYRTFTFDAVTSEITVTDPISIPSGETFAEVVLQRTVPKTTLYVSFSSGADVTRSNIDVAVKYTLMALHETLDGRWDSGAWVALYQAVQDALASQISATASAELAAKYAELGEDIEVAVGQYSAKHHSIKAAASAVSAAASAVAAATFDPALYLAKADNLSGLANQTTAQTNLGSTALGRTMFTLANAAAGRTALGAVIGTDVQAYDADLAALAALTTAGMIVRTGSGLAEARTLAAGTGISISNGDGVSGNPTITATTGATLLGTLTATSGSTQTLSGLDLTGYKLMFIAWINVSGTGAANLVYKTLALSALGGGTSAHSGHMWIDLSLGVAVSHSVNFSAIPQAVSITPFAIIGATVNADTSVSFSLSAGTFDSGTFKIYGVK